MSFRKVLGKARVVLAALPLFLLAACAPPTAAPTATPLPSATPLPPTATAAPTLTLTLTPTTTPSPTHTPTITLTPTPAADFTRLQIMAIERVVSGVMVNLFLPDVRVAYTLKLRGYDYTCTLEPQAKDHLFCVGLAEIQPDQTLTLELLDPQSGASVYSGSIYYASYPTAIPEGYAKNNCPDRGKNVHCEVECRQLPAGGYCVVATCTDACGLYRSVQTCPEGMGDFTSCTEDQWAEAKRIYGFP